MAAMNERKNKQAKKKQKIKLKINADKLQCNIYRSQFKRAKKFMSASKSNHSDWKINNDQIPALLNI